MEEDFSKYNGDGTVLKKAQLRLLEMMVEFDRICKKHNIPYFLSGGTCLGAVRHGGFIPWDDDVDIDLMYNDYRKLMKVLHRELPPKYFLQSPETDKSFYQIYSRIVDKKSRVTYGEGERVRARMEYKGLFLDLFPLEKTFSYRSKRFIDGLYIRTFRAKRGLSGNSYQRVAAFLVWPFLLAAVKIAKGLSIFSSQEKISHIYGTNIIPRLKYSNLFPTKPILFEGILLSGPAKPHEYLNELYGDYMRIPPEHKRVVHAEKLELNEYEY